MTDLAPYGDQTALADVAECEPTPTERAVTDSRESWGSLLEGFRHQLTDQIVRKIDRRLRSKICPCDVVQETFLRALRYRRSFRGLTDQELAGWLRSILDSRLMEHYKHFRAKRRDVTREVSLDANPQLARVEVRSAEILRCAPDSRIPVHERAVRVAEALQQLPDHYRLAVVSRHMNGIPLAAVAAQHGWTVHRTQKYIRRGLKQLAKLLAEFNPAAD